MKDKTEDLFGTPIARIRDGEATDFRGRTWYTNRGGARLLTEEGVPISSVALNRRLLDLRQDTHDQIPTCTGVDPNDPLEQEQTLYMQESVRTAVIDVRGLTILPIDEVILIGGKEYGTIASMIRDFGFSRPVIEQAAEGVHSTSAKTCLKKGGNKRVKIYDRAAVKNNLEEKETRRENVKATLDKNGYCTYKEEVYCMVDAYHRNQINPVSADGLRRRAQSQMDGIDVKTHNGNIRKAYPKIKLERIVRSMRAEEAEANGILTDTEGKRWTSRKTMARIFRISEKLLNRFVRQTLGNWRKVPTTKAIGLCKGRKDKLYSLDIVEEALNPLLEHEVDNGACRINGETYCTIEILDTIIPVASTNIHRRLGRQGADKKEVIDKETRSPRRVYNLRQALQIYHDRLVKTLNTANIQPCDQESASSSQEEQ